MKTLVSHMVKLLATMISNIYFELVKLDVELARLVLRSLIAYLEDFIGSVNYLLLGND